MASIREDWAKDDEYFAENMRRRREELGWTQGELSKRLKDAGLKHMHQTTVSRLEKGDRAPRIGEARGIAAVLETKIALLIAPPASVRIGDVIWRATLDLEDSYKAVTQSAEQLKVSRDIVMLKLDESQGHQAPGWYTRNLAYLRMRAEQALKYLTSDHALADRTAPQDETHFESYLAYVHLEGRDINGQHPEAP